MAEYALNTPTAVAVGTAVPFNATIIPGCCNIRHRAGSGIVNLKGGNDCKPNTYLAHFLGNVTGVAGTIQLGMFYDGELLPETLMSVVAAAATNVLSISAVTEIPAIDSGSLSVRVIEGDTVTVTDAAIIVKKE